MSVEIRKGATSDAVLQAAGERDFAKCIVIGHGDLGNGEMQALTNMDDAWKILLLLKKFERAVLDTLK